MTQELRETYIVESPEQAVALLNPLRAEILSSLTAPASAAEVARSIKETPQRVNYHLKALEKVGLVRRVGSRQVRNLVEVLYQAIAKTFILSESLGWSQETMQRAKDNSSLAHLITTSERLKQDALYLMECVDEQEEVPSASLQTVLHLGDENQRQAFVEEYVALVKQLVKKYQSKQAGAEAYSAVLAVYPEPKRGED
ncbi:winged helix-turn-helix domain-containing protein [Brevibacillus sp. B_LB10_24]|uniref:winged helix-turn-helix domain-containing protein n=1 Tax=Brevibacillus sp. B_LB10_24 TaxID=3380645 RepID=UPI0038B93272